MSTYGWIIDVDHLPDTTRPEGTNGNAKGLVGPRDTTTWIRSELKRGQGRPFRLYDDDGELCYEGRWIGPGALHGALGQSAFAPLDWAQANAGCTEIRYIEVGAGWVTL